MYVLLFFLSASLLFAEEIKLQTFEVVDSTENQSDLILKNAPMQKVFSVEEALGFAGTNGDPIKAIKTLAGVTSAGNDNGELIIHGSKPRETLITIDHLPIGYVFHLGGLYSVIAPEATKQLDAYLGGFDVSYSTMGAVIDVTPKYPYGSRNGRVHIGLYDADFALDVPLSEEFSLFLSGRRSYFDLFADEILDELAKNEDDEEEKLTFTLFPRFYDAQLMIAYDMDNNNLITLETIISKDELKLNSSLNKDKDPNANGKINQERGFETFGLRWRYTGEDQRSQTLLYHLHSYFDMQLFEENYNVEVISYTTGLYHETTWDLKNHKPTVGVEYIKEEAPIDVNSPRQPEPDDPSSYYLSNKESVKIDREFISSSEAFFIQDIWQFAQNWKFRTGIRVGTTDFQEFEGYFDHRHALVWEVNSANIFSFAGGKYSQFPEPRYVIPEVGNPEISVFEEAYHYTFNYTHNFSDKSNVKVEPYYKTFNNLAIKDNSENKIYSASGEGFARGIDLTYEYKSDELLLLLAYTFVDSERELNAQEDKLHRFYGEIPHTLQLNGSYKFKNGWRVAGLFKYSSGSPYTKIIETKELPEEVAGLRDDGETFKVPIYSDRLFEENLPYTLDVDIQIGKRWEYSESESFEFSLELMNITTLFRDNVRAIKYDDDYKEDGYYYQVPFLPAFHLTYRF
jgi:outer membrane receptor protein involved in Fe transport